MSNRRSGNDQGLTLIEVVLAVAVLTIGFIMLLGSIPSIHGTIKTNRDTARAVHHGTTVIEEIKALPSTALASYIPPVMDDLGTDEAITVLVFDNSGNEVVLPADFGAVAAGMPDPVEVWVFIQWTDTSGRPRATTVSTKKRLS